MIQIQTLQRQVSNVDEFWIGELNDITAIDPRTFQFKKEQQVPMHRLQNIMKEENNVRPQMGLQRSNVSKDALFLMGKALEMFVRELSSKAFELTREKNRVTMSEDDMKTILCRDEMYDFYIDFLQPQLDLFEGDLEELGALSGQQNEEEEEEEEEGNIPRGSNIGHIEYAGDQGQGQEKIYLQDEGGRILTLRKRTNKREVPNYLKDLYPSPVSPSVSLVREI